MSRLLPKFKTLFLHNQSFYKPINYVNSMYVISISSMKFSSTFTNIKKWLRNSSKKHEFQLNGAVLYENIVDKLDYNYFYKEFKMDDTFLSWFLITELHVWILMLRTMQEGDDGQNLRNYIVKAMWDDVNTRAKKLGHINSSIFKKQVNLLSEQFNASIIGYDEAILSNDLCLAGHLWRRFFKCENNNPEDLEKLVYYVRKQVYSLTGTLSTEIFCVSPDIKWKYI